MSLRLVLLEFSSKWNENVLEKSADAFGTIAQHFHLTHATFHRHCTRSLGAIMSVKIPANFSSYYLKLMSVQNPANFHKHHTILEKCKKPCQFLHGPAV